jgi:hypothetical protein
MATEARGSLSSTEKKMKSKGAGDPRSSVVAVYDLGPATSMTSPDFKAIVLVGFNGTFNEKSVIKQVRSGLHSSRVVTAGPHGGEMVCGYNTSSGPPSSECVWATKTTLGIVQFMSGEKLVKQAGAPALALQVRNALEVRK